MYAFPMSISSAMAIVVSYEVGAKRFDDAKTYIGLGRWTALIFAAFTLTFLYILGEMWLVFMVTTQNLSI